MHAADRRVAHAFLEKALCAMIRPGRRAPLRILHPIPALPTMGSPAPAGAATHTASRERQGRRGALFSPDLPTTQACAEQAQPRLKHTR